MDEITLENFRCFHEKQRARLAPLTLLVGENSVGKTSFMALIRALWSISYNLRVPDFKESPYDLGALTRSPTTEAEGVAGQILSRRDILTRFSRYAEGAGWFAESTIASHTISK